MTRAAPAAIQSASEKKGMVAEQRDRLESFRAFVNAAEEGEPVPPVAEDDLRRLHEISLDMAKRYVGKNEVVGVELMARVCSRGANLGYSPRWSRNARQVLGSPCCG
jgi:hypothetical protein